MARAVTVPMPFPTPFYAPLVAGVALGHFAEEGLDVTVAPAAAYPRGTMQALLDGEIEICLGGLMRSFELADRTGQVVTHFAEVCSRSGFFLLARRPMPRFTFRDLIGKTVIGFAEAPTPWQCLLTVLRRAAVDPARVRIERDRPLADAIAAFRAGEGDFLETTQPAVEELVAAGVAHVAVSMGEATGPVPFTSYMATPELLARDPDLVRRFVRAVYRTQRWLAGSEAADVARVVAPAFPTVEAGLLGRAAARFMRQHTWSRDPLLRRGGYAYLQEILLAGRFIQRAHPYGALVNTAYAHEVMAAERAAGEGRR
ncbi:MAG TPA: ABC transporter substrate-binding protein [Pseudomonadales bacterium]|nr:ABC transporter substrate-binding protein [Pseudomonadales bacterium]